MTRTPKSTHSSLRAPLDVALGDELRALDLGLARAWQILSVAGVFSGLLVYYLLGFTEGWAVSALSAFGCAFYTAQREFLGGPRFKSAISAATVIEAIMPSVFLIAIAETRSAADALGSYVPPLLFAAVTVTTIARLRPRVTLILGAVNGVAFLAIYFGRLRELLSPEELARPLYSTGMQLVRGISFIAGGGLAYLVTVALRKAIGRAERQVRSLDLFGKYRLGDKIGAGGMGVVHRAVYCPEGGFERVVAVKLLHPHLADQPPFLRGFREEAELSARLVHPNIVQVFDFGRVGDAYFLAMEHVEGLTLGGLAARLTKHKKPMPVEYVAWVGHELLSGLAHSHAVARDSEGGRLHVVHRDLCPANILLSISGEVKISDFGVAKALGEATASETKTVAGHTGYMAPEQIRAEPIDERCDLFAVGVVLWELLANQPLFRRGTEGLTSVAVLEHDVPFVTTRREGLDLAWNGFFDKALAASPAARFQTAAEMSAALSALCDTARSRQDELAGLVAWGRSVPSPNALEAEADRTAPTAIVPR